MEREGVIKFQIETAHKAVIPHDAVSVKHQILEWSQVFRKMGWLGVDPTRYGGLGFGNLSMRIGKRVATQGQRSFVITGSQTGGLTTLSRQHLAMVQKYSLTQSTAWKLPGIDPSSESLTHAAVYDSAANARACFHIHCPTIWHARARLGLPTVPSHVRYGTPEMVRAIRMLCVHDKVGYNQPIAMGGHEDGLLCFSDRPEDAFLAFIQVYRASSV